MFRAATSTDAWFPPLVAWLLSILAFSAQLSADAPVARLPMSHAPAVVEEIEVQGSGGRVMGTDEATWEEAGVHWRPDAFAAAAEDGDGDEEGDGGARSPDDEEPVDEEASMPTDASRSQRSRFGRLRDQGHYLILVPSIRVEASFGVEFGTSGRYAYRPNGRSLNMILLSLQNRFSTKMVQEHELALRLRDLLGHGELFIFDARFINDPRFTYAGVANGERLSNEELEEDSFYRLSVRTIGGRFGYQHPLWRSRGAELPSWWNVANLSIISTFRFEEDRASYSMDSLFAQDGGGRTSTRRGSLTAGLVYDARDRDVSPNRGSYHELSFEGAAPWLGSTDTWGRLNLGLRWFVPLGTDRVIAALRLGGEAMFGAPPYFALGQFGGIDAIDGFGGRMVGRGFYRRRFIGRYKTYATPEFRFIPLETQLGKYRIDVGLNVFADAGGIWDRGIEQPAGFQISGGGGGFLRLDDFFVVRIEAAASDEGFQLYLATDHAF